jgi:hypothetical protein
LWSRFDIVKVFVLSLCFPALIKHYTFLLLLCSFQVPLDRARESDSSFVQVATVRAGMIEGDFGVINHRLRRASLICGSSMVHTFQMPCVLLFKFGSVAAVCVFVVSFAKHRATQMN